VKVAERVPCDGEEALHDRDEDEEEGYVGVEGNILGRRDNSYAATSPIHTKE
jgi:hypothetical protein